MNYEFRESKKINKGKFDKMYQLNIYFVDLIYKSLLTCFSRLNKL